MSEYLIKCKEDIELLLEDKTPDFLLKKEKEVEALFQAYQKKESKREIFNGPVLVCKKDDSLSWTCFFSEYQYVIAQRIKPELFEEKFYSLAVTGIGFWRQNILLGKRSQEVYEERGLYEMLPSGAIDTSCLKDGRIEYFKQILQEIEEEAGVNPKFIENLETKGLIVNEEKYLIDLIVQFEVEKSFDVFKNKKTDGEYIDLLYLSEKEFNDFFINNVEELSSTLKLIAQEILNVNLLGAES
jgi:hypothetical protein